VRGLAALALLALAPGFAVAQDCPEAGAVLYPGLTGTVLQDSLRARYRPPVGLDYAGARDVMYTIVDNHDGHVTGIYTGFTVTVDPHSTTPRADAFSAGINAEHSWPQSKGASNLPAEADLHHLFPSEINANAARGNYPFAEIPDVETDSWYRLRQVVSTPDPQYLDEYSELDRGKAPPGYDGRWEVREDHKGDTARAMFYFYTMYRAEANAADPAFFGAQKDALRQWNQEDPPDSAERARTCMVAVYQAGKVNPFVIDPTLADRAYFDGVPVAWVSFRAEPSGAAVELRWEVADAREAAGYRVLRSRGTEERLTPSPILETRFRDATGVPGRRYDYWVEAVARDGSLTRVGPRAVVYPARPVVAVAEPNPARAGAAVRFLVDGAPAERARVFDVSGRDVSGAGGAAPVAAGVYLVRVERGGQEATLRLTVLP